MKNASLITTIIALLVGAAGGYFIGNKGSKNETASNKIKNSNVISGNGPSSANRQSGASSKKDQSGGDSSIPSVEGDLADEAKRLFDSGDVAGALQKILNAPGQMGRMEALLGFVKTFLIHYQPRKF